MRVGGDMSKFRAMRPEKMAWAELFLKANPQTSTAKTLADAGRLQFGSWVDNRVNRDWFLSFKLKGTVYSTKKAKKEKLKKEEPKGALLPRYTTIEKECKKLLGVIEDNFPELLNLWKEMGVDMVVFYPGDISFNFEETVKESFRIGR
jgi:hypothetical protein